MVRCINCICKNVCKWFNPDDEIECDAYHKLFFGGLMY